MPHTKRSGVRPGRSYSLPQFRPLVAQPIPRADGQAGHFELGMNGGVNGTCDHHTGGTSPVGVGDGWYSYNLGTWHLISLNIECSTQPERAVLLLG